MEEMNKQIKGTIADKIDTLYRNLNAHEADIELNTFIENLKHIATEKLKTSIDCDIMNNDLLCVYVRHYLTMFVNFISLIKTCKNIELRFESLNGFISYSGEMFDMIFKISMNQDISLDYLLETAKIYEKFIKYNDLKICSNHTQDGGDNMILNKPIQSLLNIIKTYKMYIDKYELNIENNKNFINKIRSISTKINISPENILSLLIRFQFIDITDFAMLAYSNKELFERFFQKDHYMQNILATNRQLNKLFILLKKEDISLYSIVQDEHFFVNIEYFINILQFICTNIDILQNEEMLEWIITFLDNTYTIHFLDIMNEFFIHISD